jgi:hypothetical protein
VSEIIRLHCLEVMLADMSRLGNMEQGQVPLKARLAQLLAD